jgi:hypothetical protein
MSDNLLALVLERDKEIAALHKAMDERAEYNGALQKAAYEAYDILEAERDRLREALTHIDKKALTAALLAADHTYMEAPDDVAFDRTIEAAIAAYCAALAKEAGE